MKKHPSHLKVCGRLVEAVAAVRDVPVTLYEGTYNGAGFLVRCCEAHHLYMFQVLLKISVLWPLIMSTLWHVQLLPPITLDLVKYRVA